MKNAVLILLAGLLAGVALTLWLDGANEVADTVATAVQGDDSRSDPRLESLMERVAALEQQLAAMNTGAATEAEGSNQNRLAELDEEIPEEEQGFEPPTDPQDFRRERLQEAGFAAMDAERIVNLEQDVQLERLNTRWQQRRQAYLDDPDRFDPLRSNPMRAELGEQDYQQYLEAMGRSTAVSVGGVFENSPAATAGLQPGDNIRRYDGERIYNLRELNAMSVQGNQGEPVLLEVERDGTNLQLAIERGPLGINIRRAGRRGF